MLKFKEYIEESRVNDTRKTQVSTTGGTYFKTGQFLKDKIPANGKIISIGAGLSHTKKALKDGLGKGKHVIHDMEPNPEGRDEPPEFTSGDQIPHDTYHAAVSHNVLNVVEPEVRDSVMDSIFDSLKTGGHAVIGTRKWTGDISKAKNYDAGSEPKSMWVKKGEATSYQKGFDGNELKDYVIDYAQKKGYNVDVNKLNGIAATSVHVKLNSK